MGKIRDRPICRGNRRESQRYVQELRRELLNIVAVADTHTAIWYSDGDKRLSLSAKRLMDRAANAGNKIGVASISLVELVYLVEKGRVPLAAYDDLQRVLADPEHLLTELVLDAGVSHALWQVSRAEVPDMPDRIIAATGVSLGVPVISRDGRIQASTVRTIW